MVTLIVSYVTGRFVDALEKKSKSEFSKTVEHLQEITKLQIGKIGEVKSYCRIKGKVNNQTNIFDGDSIPKCIHA